MRLIGSAFIGCVGGLQITCQSMIWQCPGARGVPGPQHVASPMCFEFPMPELLRRAASRDGSRSVVRAGLRDDLGRMLSESHPLWQCPGARDVPGPQHVASSMRFEFPMPEPVRRAASRDGSRSVVSRKLPT